MTPRGLRSLGLVGYVTFGSRLIHASHQILGITCKPQISLAQRTHALLVAYSLGAALTYVGAA